MEAVLRSLNLEGDLARYVRCFQIAGFRTFDDLLIEEPSLRDLEVIGINNANDRDKIFYEINPEAAVMDAGLGAGGGGLQGGGSLSIYNELADDFGDDGMSATEQEYARLKAEYETLASSAASPSSAPSSSLSETEREYQRMQQEYAQLLNTAKSFDTAASGGLSEAEREFQRMQAEYASIKAQLNDGDGAEEREAMPMTAAEREYQRLQEEYAQLRGQLTQDNTIDANSEKSNTEEEYEAMQAEYAELKRQLDRGEMSRTSRTISAAEAEYTRLRAEYDAMQNELQRMTIEEKPEDEMTEMAAEYKRLQTLSQAKRANPNLPINQDDVDAPPPATPPLPPPTGHVPPTHFVHNRSVSTATSTGSLTNAQIASKAREMLGNGADRQSVAQWVRHQQALQQRATAPHRFQATNTRPLQNNRTSMAFNNDPTASFRMGGLPSSISQPTLSQVAENSASENSEGAEEVRRLPRTTSASAQAISARTGRTLVPIEGSRISGVTLVQNDNAREQIEALKQLASDGQNLTFGNDLTIEVLDPVTVGKGTNLVTLFLVRLTTNMKEFSHLTFHRLEVRRRFSHFEGLYQKLVVATNDTLNLPKFPKKDFFGRTSAAIIEQRLQYFKMMMALIAKNPGLRCLSCVVDFFDDTKMDDLKLNDDGTAKLKGTSITGRMKRFGGLLSKKQ